MAVQRRAAAAAVASQDPTQPGDEREGTSRGTSTVDAAPRLGGGNAAAAGAALSIQPRVAYNIGLHSLLMLVLPLGLFFSSSTGLLDPVYAATFGIPRTENKTLIGAVLAVLGVNVVIASFLISAFNEPEPPPLKRD